MATSTRTRFESTNCSFRFLIYRNDRRRIKNELAGHIHIFRFYIGDACTKANVPIESYVAPDTCPYGGGGIPLTLSMCVPLPRRMSTSMPDLRISIPGAGHLSDLSALSSDLLGLPAAELYSSAKRSCRNIHAIPGSNYTSVSGTVDVAATYKSNLNANQVTAAPSPQVTAAPSPQVTAAPSPQVTAAPSPQVTAAPSPQVTAAPSPQVTAAPSPQVTAAPSPQVTAAPVCR